MALTANMHLVAATPHALTVEVDQTGNPFIEALLVGGLRVTEGQVELPQGPGLGIELNQDTVRKYTVPREQATPPGNYSDMVFM